MPDYTEMRKVAQEIFKDKLNKMNQDVIIPQKYQNEQLVLRVQLLETEIQYLKQLMQHTFNGHRLVDGRFEKVSVQLNKGE